MVEGSCKVWNRARASLDALGSHWVRSRTWVDPKGQRWRYDRLRQEAEAGRDNLAAILAALPDNFFVPLASGAKIRAESLRRANAQGSLRESLHPQWLDDAFRPRWRGRAFGFGSRSRVRLIRRWTPSSAGRPVMRRGP